MTPAAITAVKAATVEAAVAMAIREPVTYASECAGSRSTTAPASGQQAPQPT